MYGACSLPSVLGALCSQVVVTLYSTNTLTQAATRTLVAACVKVLVLNRIVIIETCLKVLVQLLMCNVCVLSCYGGKAWLDRHRS
jgi:hypothetical protein